jgi:mono/diheme cytochrome c family protein
MKFSGVHLASAAAAMAAATVAACALAAEPAPAAVSPPAGQQLYARHCLSCHQADGGGVPNMQPPIAGGSWMGDPRALALFVMTGGFTKKPNARIARSTSGCRSRQL